MIPVWYDADCDQIWIGGQGQTFARRSLVASIEPGDAIGIRLKAGASTDLLLKTAFGNVTDAAGNTFPSAIAAKDYLDREFAKQRDAGEAFGAATVAGASLVQGQPVAVSRETGQLLPARADSYPLSFVVGLASADTDQGFANRPAHGAVTLADWTAQTGAPVLRIGLPYFLGPTGGLTTVPDRTTICLTRVGYAVSPATLVASPLDPILL